jgi:two-component system cell cycle sensor histidine kinase PleC
LDGALLPMAMITAESSPKARWVGRVPHVLRLPEDLRRSLKPESEDAARMVEVELDSVRANIRLLDWALPLIGAVIIFVHKSWAPVPHMLTAFVLVALACGLNEAILLRLDPQHSDVIVRASKKASITTLAALISMSAWVLFGLSLFVPPASDIFALLILSCTLAAAATLFSAHLASAAAAMFAISLGIAVLELINSYYTGSPLLTLAFVYVGLMTVQCYAIHARFEKAWRLEHDREQLIKNLRVARDAAVSASRAKSEFLANMSHELRTPLNAIIGFSDIVRTKAFGDSSDKYAEYGGFIHQSGNRLLELIGDILDLARIEAGRKMLQREPVNVDDLIADELTRRSETAAARGVELVHLREHPVPLLFADLQAVRQVLDNLVSNAIKFTPKGGRVSLGASLNHQGEIALRVADTGLGIAREEQARIFDRFGSGRPEITTAQRGTGLGLQIVKGLVDMHGGRIELHSVLGEGTCVTIIFPAASTAATPVRSVA